MRHPVYKVQSNGNKDQFAVGNTDFGRKLPP